MIAHDIGNFVGDNLTVAQVNALIERAPQDREADRVPQPNLQLPPGIQLVNGAAVHPPPVPAPRPAPVRAGEAQAPAGVAPDQVRPRVPAMTAARRRDAHVGPRRRIMLREEDEASDDDADEEED